MSQLKIGQQLSGSLASYKIITDELGPGGRGETYKASIVKTNILQKKQKVVIKIPRLKKNKSFEEIRKRLCDVYQTFLVEIALHRQFKKLDCTAQILDCGFVPIKYGRYFLQSPFIVQTFIDGKSLCDFMDSKYENFTGIPEAVEFFKWAKKLSHRLLRIHQRQVIHADIWPPNIMVQRKSDGEEVPVFIDFGEASFRELAIDAGGRYGSKQPFVAPEGSGTVGADIYSLGCVLLYLATGRKKPPEEIKKIEMDNIDTLKNTIAREIKHYNNRLYEENSGVVDIITRCLRRSQHQRIPHAEGLLQDIETFTEESNNKFEKVKIVSIQKEYDNLDRNNPLFSWMASLKMRLLLRNIEDMKNGVYDLIGDHETLVNGLTQYLSFLGKGDQYLTLSLPSFWYSKNIGINGRFLTMNKLAAERGAIIRRIFLITDEDKKHPELKEIIESHKNTMEELSSKIPVSKTSTENGKGKYYTGIKEVDESTRKQMYKERKHFGLLIKGKKKIWIFPIYRKDDETVVAIQFRTEFDLEESIREKFDTLLDESKPIQEYYPELLHELETHQVTTNAQGT